MSEDGFSIAKSKEWKEVFQGDFSASNIGKLMEIQQTYGVNE